MNKYVLKINDIYDQVLSAAIGRNERKKLNKFINREPSKYEAYSKDNAEEWLKRWSVLGKTDKVFYRYYSRYIGESPDILPDDLMHNVIEPLLNPMRFRGLYADKNMFDKLLKPYFNESVTPKTIFRCIKNGLFDADYYVISKNQAIKLIQKAESSFLVAKPTVDSSSGNNILFFDKKGEEYYSRDKRQKLEIDVLSKELGPDFVLQEGQLQSEEMKVFNSTSINTLRVATYFSVESQKPVVLNGVLRVGKQGAFVDNAHAGGCLIGISRDGKLQSFCSDQFGNQFTEFNGIDFSKQEFVIPNYEKVGEFAQNIAASLPHQRILALDIMLDQNNQPKLIEFNNYAFGVWAFQQTIGSLFGSYTDEVINYCKTHKKEATRIYLTY